MKKRKKNYLKKWEEKCVKIRMNFKEHEKNKCHAKTCILKYV